MPGQKHDVNFTLSDSICAPVAGLNEFDKNALVSKIEKNGTQNSGSFYRNLVSLGSKLVHFDADSQRAQVQSVRNRCTDPGCIFTHCS